MTVLNDPAAILAKSSMTRAQVIAVGLATLLNALDGFDVLSISFAAPGIATQFGIDRAALGVVLSMELIGMAVGALVLGNAADKIGRRPMLLSCLAVMSAGMALAATSDSIAILSAYRLFTGFGIGGMLATTAAVVAEFANARYRNLAVAIMAGGYPVGAVVGGSIASALLSGGGTWHSIFVFGAIATAAFVPLILWLMPETIAFLVLRHGPAGLSIVNRQLEKLGHRSADHIPELEPGTQKVRWRELFGPGLASVSILLLIAYFMHIMTFYFFVKWVPKLVVDMGFEAGTAGSVLVWANVGGASGSLVLSLFTQRFPVRTLTILAMIAGAGAVIWFGQPHSDIATLSVIAGTAGFFVNGATAGIYAMFAQSYPARLRASGTGMVIGFGRGGAALGPIVAGFLLASGLTLPWLATIMACGSLIAALALTVLRYREHGVA
ncbi:MFS transporter [Novosphingobium album (ex Hu et al. 2023)]|uniref:MFS transporter n=1 Tax=Novosphingobium album (ex Hu et al. 2023) TaxID=2930093 RepID=A0ABT0B5N8_9SPHN|nr:MFS transporter [Novosphingobium album (ex Hu et al. 2023)]MCJ2180196.1 MFS transporter [Novosphingobium album (ex Hu et al. 2023)]